MVQAFITGLQFLTRIRIAKQTEWSAEGFGRSVRFFPLVGAVLGLAMVFVYNILEVFLPLAGIFIPGQVTAAVLLGIYIVLTGGLHCDGFMDTIDGIFSGRSRERMLEIMKDSRVGAYGVVAFQIIMLLKWSLFFSLSSFAMPFALFAMPVLGRFAMVIGIACFPYARPEGIGRAFADFAGKYAIHVAFVITLLLIVPMGKQGLAACAVVGIFSVLFSHFVTKVLGGLTGDVYGAITELAEILVLFVYLLLK